MKPKLREVDYVFELSIADGSDWHMVTVQCGLLDGELHVTFSIAGEAQVSLPAELVDGIREALEFARKRTRAQDLSEKDPSEK